MSLHKPVLTLTFIISVATVSMHQKSLYVPNAGSAILRRKKSCEVSVWFLMVLRIGLRVVIQTVSHIPRDDHERYDLVYWLVQGTDLSVISQSS